MSQVSFKTVAVMLGLAVVVLSVSGCSGRGGLSIADYPSVAAASPPQPFVGLWAGPHAGGTLFIEISAQGSSRGCLSVPPLHQRMNGKYFGKALYFEDGSRIEVRVRKGTELVISSPPGNPVATLTRSSANADLARCAL